MKYVISIFVIMVLFGAVYGTTTDPQFWNGVAEAREANEQAEAARDTSGDWKIPAIGLGMLVLIIGMSALANSQYAAPAFIAIGIIALVLAVSGLYTYGLGETKGTGVVAMVQADGNAPKNDLMYSQTNQGNAKANVFNEGALAIRNLVLIIVIFIAAGIGFVFWRGGA